MTEVAPTGATAWGALARTPAVQTIRFWPEGELLILAGYRRDPGRAGAMLLGRRASGWEKLWSEEQDGCSIERLQLADVLGEGKPQLLVGWDAGPSLGGRLEVLSWTGNGLASVAVLVYHRLDVVDLSGTYARDGRCELAVWTKDTGDAYPVEVYRWYEGRFVPAPDTYGTYYPEVVDYYAQRTREHPDVRAYWYYLALAQVRAQEERAALDSLARARALNGHPGDAALFLVEGDALCVLGRYGDALADFLRDFGPAAGGSGDLLGRLGGWAGKRGLAVHAVRILAGPENWPRDVPRPTVVLMDWAPAEQAEAGMYAAHGIYWWSGDRLYSQVLYAADASGHGLGQTCALAGQAVLAPGPGGSVELGVVYDEAAGGSGSPRPVFYLWRQPPGGDSWRLLWRSSGPEWRNSHGKVTISPDLRRITVESDSWLVPDGKAEIFHESNPGPHRHFVDTWVRRDGGDAYAPVRYDRMEAETLPSAYATLVDFVVALSTGAEARARELVADPPLVDEARRLGLVQLPPGQRWMLDFPDPAVETAGPLTILDGPAAGVTVSFVRRGDAWLMAGFSR
ncbi:MAG: hypothetical protein QME87_08275 [Bacillota bacterium]|nr:hypothetical protein [Bacillota bacterium]